MKFEKQFEDREWVARPRRVDTGFVVRVCCDAGEFPARVTNLSSAGFGLRAARALEPGWEVSLEVPKLAAVKCIILWARGKNAGGIFLDPVAL